MEREGMWRGGRLHACTTLKKRQERLSSVVKRVSMSCIVHNSITHWDWCSVGRTEVSGTWSCLPTVYLLVKEPLMGLGLLMAPVTATCVTEAHARVNLISNSGTYKCVSHCVCLGHLTPPLGSTPSSSAAAPSVMGYEDAILYRCQWISPSQPDSLPPHPPLCKVPVITCPCFSLLLEWVRQANFIPQHPLLHNLQLGPRSILFLTRAFPPLATTSTQVWAGNVMRLFIA